MKLSPLPPHVCDSLGKLANCPSRKTSFSKKRIDKSVCLLDEFFLLKMSGQEEKIQPVVESFKCSISKFILAALVITGKMATRYDS